MGKFQDVLHVFDVLAAWDGWKWWRVVLTMDDVAKVLPSRRKSLFKILNLY